MEFVHKSVLLDECINALSIKGDGIYVDATAGGAGHSIEIAKKLTTGKLICIDRDETALSICKDRLKQYGERIVFVQDNFSNIGGIINGLNIAGIDGILVDLGVSSHQLDEAQRGFSYRFDADLDMRMDTRQSKTANDVVNGYTLEELSRIISDYGEEKFAYSIAKKIVAYRQTKQITTTNELTDIIKSAIPAKFKRDKHPSKQTFQAIRIEVNNELSSIEQLTQSILEISNSGARIAIITFHSLEDRIIKTAFNDMARGCICDKNMPICVCNNKPKIKLITKKPIISSSSELDENKRAKSAKLRVAEVI